MASRVSKLPDDQLREKEKDGRIRRFLWDVLTLRVLAYVISQPASFTFIASFLIITLVMPPMAAYIKNAHRLPDLDTMRSWNAYLGNLPSRSLCVSRATPSSYSPAPSQCTAASAFIDFHIDSDVLQSAISDNVTIFHGVFLGTVLKTKIKDSVTKERIDDQVNVTLFLRVNVSGFSDNSSQTTMNGCVDICAPANATPARHPQIPYIDFTFNTRVLHSKNKPNSPRGGYSCSEYYPEGTVQNITLGGSCEDVRPSKEKYRRHGLINIYLREDQKEESYRRILLGTLGVAMIGLAFSVGISCTERPPKPKNRPE